MGVLCQIRGPSTVVPFQLKLTFKGAGLLDVYIPKTPWDVMGCQNHLFGGPRGVTRRVWCFHMRGREP